jgi:RNA polymerase sigma-70 factor (ECF subfamily)
LQKEYTDKELQALLQKDSEQAIILIFKRYYNYLCKIVYKIIPDYNLVEDLTQEVFFELWRKKEQLSVTASLKAYIRRAAVNKSLNYIRDQKIKFSDEEQYPVVKSKQPSVTQQLEADELQLRIDEAIDSLPERCRVIFVLSRFEDMSYSEIADSLGIAVKTVENQISKALRLLRVALQDYL